MSGIVARPLIIDAGPTLTFTAAGYSGLLVEVVSKRGNRLLTPETVVDEVDRKAQSAKFAGCDQVLSTLIGAEHVGVLPDAISDKQLAQQVRRITGVGTAIRLGESKDLGETMVIAHALKLQTSGVDVRVLIDEWRGQQVAMDHGLKVVSTEMILLGAIDLSLISDRGEMRSIYQRLRDYDDGLVHIDQTALLERGRYRAARQSRDTTA